MQKFDFSSFSTIELKTEKPDYFQDGEILDVVANPQQGSIDIEIDTVYRLISEENYRQLPTRYVINRYGKVNNQVILTFDDGPDPEYTPRILDILKKEKVPAAAGGADASNAVKIKLKDRMTARRIKGAR